MSGDITRIQDRTDYHVRFATVIYPRGAVLLISEDDRWLGLTRRA